MKGRLYADSLLLFTAVVLTVDNAGWVAGFVAGLAIAEISMELIEWWVRRGR